MVQSRKGGLTIWDLVNERVGNEGLGLIEAQGVVIRLPVHCLFWNRPFMTTPNPHDGFSLDSPSFTS